MSSSKNQNKLKILVVDDEPDNLDLLYRSFYRDYKVLRAASGPEALDILAKEGEVAVIISDQRMPQMSGTEFLSLTASQYPDTIRIILTGYTDVEDLVEAINSGKVFKYVTKPWEAEELKTLVKQAIDTHNVLKSRTEELRRALRQESLLYAVTNTIRSAPNYQKMLQRIVETVGQMFEVSCCLLRPVQDGQMLDEWFIHERGETKNKTPEDGSHKNSILTPERLPFLVWETMDVEVIQDIQTDEKMNTPEFTERRKAYQELGVSSSLIVPLFYRVELIAILALHQFDIPRQWQDYEVQLLITVADQAALALSQSRAYEQVRALAKREALVNTITSAIRSSLDPKSIFAAITQQLGQALQVDGCALSLWTEDDEYVQCVGLYDAAVDEVAVRDWEQQEGNGENSPVMAFASPNSLPQSLAPIRGNPVLQKVMMTRAPVAISDLHENPHFNIAELALRSPARALLIVPLLSDGRIIGSISLRQNNYPRFWEPSEIELAQVVATQASIAVQQARLYQTTRQQAEQLLVADRLKTEFFQNISHEFRTPLTLMIGPLETVCNRRQDLPYEQAQIALRNSRRLLRLVNQLLDLQKLDAGRMQPSFRPCDLVGFCRNIVESFRAYCEKKGIHLVTYLRDCPPLYLDVDRFDKVIYNLLSNAIKFTPPDGTITLTVEPVGQYCLLHVKDTGIGIRQDQIPYLFERFRQAEGSASRSYEGTGLGLALVKELVDLHHGKISVDSTYNQGTTFTIWLHFGTTHLPPDQVLAVPAELQLSRAAVEFADVEDMGVNAHGSSSDEPQSLILGSQYPTILVVDDNPDLRRYVSHVVSDSGFNVLLAKNGTEGFEVAKNYHPDIIVTDLMMPIVSGLDLIRMIRQDEELRGTPMILLTAKADEDTRIEGVEQGADAYLSKPFNDRELLAELRNLLALKETEKRVQQLNNYLTESVLRRFLPPAMVKKAAAGDLSLDLRPEPRLVTILFSDIVGFTQLANRLQVRRISEVLNEYLGEMTQAVFDNGGTVDKFVGDAVMALFGAPEELEPEEQVKRAIASVRKMLNSLDLLNERWREQGIINEEIGVSPVRFRCGIHQGPAVVGLFGGVLRSDYTAIGPSVNVAARLQEVAEPNTILVSSEVAVYVPSAEIVPYKDLHLKGFDEPVASFLVSREPC